MEIDQQIPQKPAVKLIEVRLSGLKRVEYTEVVQVPVDITQEEIDRLVDERYDVVDGGDFTDDPDYWERGTCYATQTDTPNAVPTVLSSRDEDGFLEMVECTAAVSDSDASGVPHG